MAKKISMTPEQYAEKQARNLKSSTTDIERGINAVERCPTHLTDQQFDKMRRRFNEAMDSGKTRKANYKVTLDEWKDKAIKVGIPRIAAGIDAAKPKVEAFAARLFPHIENGLVGLEKMPKITIDDSINRVTFWIKHMAGMNSPK